MLYIIIAIVMFGLLIGIHELGHFTAAKLCGVRVLEFSIGMGPLLWHKDGAETKYSLRLLPLGGYCSLEGEDQESDDPRAFSRAAGWKRFLILIAGSLANFLIGLIIVLGLFAASTGHVTPVLSGFEDGFPCQGAEMLMAGDEITAIDGKTVLTYSDVPTLLNRRNNGTHDVTVRRDGIKVKLNDLPLVPREYQVDGKRVTMYGMYFQSVPGTLPGNLRLGFATSLDFARLIWWSLEDLISGAVGVNALTGPIGIVDSMSDMAKSSESVRSAVINLLYFGAFIAINLSVMNLLPIPALDGGRVLFLLLNGLLWLVCKKNIPTKYESYVHLGGMALLFSLMIFVAVQDVMRLMG